ncbi:MAG: hypothetical protein WA825_15475 [Steroidobacteraceae bacterium]
MKQQSAIAGVKAHVRARMRNTSLTDQVAELVGAGTAGTKRVLHAKAP